MPALRKTVQHIHRCEMCNEAGLLSGYAKLSSEVMRPKSEMEHEYRSAFARDRDRIMYTNAFRRLVHKTQTIVAPDPSKCTTRLIHTVKVSQVAQTICRALRLNEDLAVAIALGHDIGHPPFGHLGEDAIREQLMDINGFEHNEESVWMLMQFEELNLTLETLEGILKHTRFSYAPYKKHSVKRKDPFERFTVHGCPRSFEHPFHYFGYEDRDGRIQFEQPPSLEGQVVDIADEIVYLTHDLVDLRNARLVEDDELPNWWVSAFGTKAAERNAIDTLVTGVIDQAAKQLINVPDRRTFTISHPPALSEMVSDIKTWYSGIYTTKLVAQSAKANENIDKVFLHFEKDPGQLGRYSSYFDRVYEYGYRGKQLVAHCMAAMTDQEVESLAHCVDTGVFT